MKINYIRPLPVAIFSLCAASANSQVVDDVGLMDVEANATGVMEHCDDIVADRDFIETFDCGDELFEIRYNALDGAGMNVGDGGRFTRVPRADLLNWSGMLPSRETGPNGDACNVCHLAETIGGAGDGAGPAALNVIRDPFHTANPAMFIQRNTPHLFGMAGPQLLAEEMTAELHAQVDAAIAAACTGGRKGGPAIEVALEAKGIDFGTARISSPCVSPTVHVDGMGIANDLVVRPFQWKGNELSIRTFSRGAFHNELGMEPVELGGDGIDNDFDGISDEVTIADITAMEVYLAGQPRPTTLIELDMLRDTLVAADSDAGAHLADEMGLPDLESAEIDDINDGEAIFLDEDLGCSGCHVPALTVENVYFSSPSTSEFYRDGLTLPAGQSTDGVPGLDPDLPILFDITEEMPDNLIELDGQQIAHLGNFETDDYGNAIIRLYGDLKLHDMGPALAENIDETGAGASVWMTKELWGLGNTAPYLHDGRATTIEEAIILHGGEAESSKLAFAELDDEEQDKVLAFLENPVLFLPAGEEE
jgi:hypothetical protein